MAGDPNGGDDAEDLAERIARAREAIAPQPSKNWAEKYNSASLAWRMTLELVVGCAIGFGFGWGLDALTGLAPLFMVVLGLLGFAAGVRTAMASAREAQEAGRVADKGSVDGGAER